MIAILPLGLFLIAACDTYRGRRFFAEIDPDRSVAPFDNFVISPYGSKRRSHIVLRPPLFCCGGSRHSAVIFGQAEFSAGT